MATVLVGTVYRLHGNASITVPEDATLDYIVALLGHEKHLRAVFFVDSDQRFTNMISSCDLLRYLRAHAGNQKTDILAEFFRSAGSKKAKDLQASDSRALSVKESDDVQTALQLMLACEQDVIPVLDGEGRVLGDVSLSEVLLKALEGETS